MIAAGREVCNGCPVRVECLTAALQRNEHYDMWGGFTRAERRRIAPLVHGTIQRAQSCDCHACELGVDEWKRTRQKLIT